MNGTVSNDRLSLKGNGKILVVLAAMSISTAMKRKRPRSWWGGES